MRFPDGAHFRSEVPTYNSAVTFRVKMETAEKHGVTVNKVDETFGIIRNTDETILEYIYTHTAYPPAVKRVSTWASKLSWFSGWWRDTSQRPSRAGGAPKAWPYPSRRKTKSCLLLFLISHLTT